MLARGFNVAATDGSPEMAAVASRRLGRTVETLLFHDLDEVAAYEAVWANACLLHVRRGSELADVLARIWGALKPAGVFYASYKAGDADGRDALNRYYNYPSPDWLRATYAEAGNWSSLSIECGEVIGFDEKYGIDALRRGSKRRLTIHFPSQRRGGKLAHSTVYLAVKE